MSAQLHNHILVVRHLHPGDILLHPISLESTLLPVGQEVVDGVLQPTLVAVDPRCDGLPSGISNIVAVRGPESWSLVSAKDSGSKQDLCDGFELHPPRTRDFLDPVPGVVVMPRCSRRARTCRRGLELRPRRTLLVLGVTWGRALFIGLVFYVLVL
jgi:hypothetical protein